MVTKFYEEFVKATNGEFPELKLNSATYVKADRELIIRFIINTFDKKKFDAEKEAKVKRVCEQMFNGVKVTVQYIMTYADEVVVKNKIMDFLNSANQMIFRRISDKNLKIAVDGGNISVTFYFDEATVKMLSAGDFVKKIIDELSRSFNETVRVNVVAVQMDEKDLEQELKTTVVRTDSVRLIKAVAREKIYAGRKVESISQLPNYICDVKSEGDGIILCGRVANVSVGSYGNKKFDPNDSKCKEPERKPLVRFSINDTTGGMDCVCFPSSQTDADAIGTLKDGDEIICLGRTSTSQRTGTLSYTVNAIFRCEIDFDSIQLFRRRPEPDSYRHVFPEKYQGMSEQGGLLDIGMSKADEFFDGKTIVVFDLETTSAAVATTEIIEIGAIKLVDGVETEIFRTLVKPSGHIPEEATLVNHITDDMVKDSPSIDKVLPDFFKFTYGAYLAGHNVEGFDFPIIKRVGNDIGYYFDNPLIDTLLLARRYITGRTNYRLESIAKDMKFTHTDAHRALSDVEATVALLREIAKRM